MSEPGFRCVALIPARSGSKRLPDKNVRCLGGHPLVAYSIAACRASAVFDAVVVSTDSASYASLAREYGASVPFLRPAELSDDLAPDIGWVLHALRALRDAGEQFDCFSIIRPTSPFRSAATIRRAWRLFRDESGAIDSLRAVERCSQHPAKMWTVDGRRMTPFLGAQPAGLPWHSTPYQALPAVHVQNASLEIAWSRVALEGGTIAGTTIAPFFTEGYEGFDVNRPDDWILAEELVRRGMAQLPEIPAPAAQPQEEHGSDHPRSPA